MTLLPAATDTPDLSVMVMLVPMLLPVAVPTFLTKAMPARASHAARPNRRASASVATARRAGCLPKLTFMVPEGRSEAPRGISADAVAGLKARFAEPPGSSARRAEARPGAGPRADRPEAFRRRRHGVGVLERRDPACRPLGYGRLALVVSGKERVGTLRLFGGGKMCVDILMLASTPHTVLADDRADVSLLRMASADRSVFRGQTIPPPFHESYAAMCKRRAIAPPALLGSDRVHVATRTVSGGLSPQPEDPGKRQARTRQARWGPQLNCAPRAVRPPRPFDGRSCRA